MVKGGSKKSKGEADGRKIVATNRKARYDYEILDTYEAGIMLVGPEVKSLRAGELSLQDAYARVQDGELWLHGMYVKPYELAKDPPEATRARKLLLHRHEIDRLVGTSSTQGTTLIPLQVYFKHGLAKVQLAMVKGRRKYDKRQAIREKEMKREAERALRARR